MRKVLRWLLWKVLRLLWSLVPEPVRLYFEARFRNVSRSEKWGYGVWTLMGLFVGVPEVWAAISGDCFWWPTISTTVGHLETRWPVVALIPVALIVMCCYSVFRVGAGSLVLQTDLKALGRTSEGRLKKQDVSRAELERGIAADRGRHEWGVVRYLLFAGAVVIVGAVLATTSNNRFLVGYVLYSLILVFWLLIPNIAAYWFKRDVPFTTVFFTVRLLGQRLQLVAAIVAALLVILLLHLAFYPWPSLANDDPPKSCACASSFVPGPGVDVLDGGPGGTTSSSRTERVETAGRG